MGLTTAVVVGGGMATVDGAMNMGERVAKVVKSGKNMFAMSNGKKKKKDTKAAKQQLPWDFIIERYEVVDKRVHNDRRETVGGITSVMRESFPEKKYSLKTVALLLRNHGQKVVAKSGSRTQLSKKRPSNASRDADMEEVVDRAKNGDTEGAFKIGIDRCMKEKKKGMKKIMDAGQSAMNAN